MKYIVEISLNCTYEFDGEKYTEDEAVDKAWDYFLECQPDICVDREED